MRFLVGSLALPVFCLALLRNDILQFFPDGRPVLAVQSGPCIFPERGLHDIDILCVEKDEISRRIA